MRARPRAAAPVAPRPAVIVGTGRPDRYVDAAGGVVPSVTTVTKRFSDASGLIVWSYKNGHADGLAGKPVAPNAARDEAADAGHVAHDWILDTVAGRPLTAFPFSDAATLEQAANALDAFHAWSAEVSLVVLAVEVPLVHSVLRFGGTFDGVGLVHGVPRILDWKSGKRLYAEHLMQVAAYRELLRDAARSHSIDVPAPDDAAVIRLDKLTGAPEAKLFGSDALDLGWDYFAKIRGLYDLGKDLEKMVAPPKKKAA